MYVGRGMGAFGEAAWGWIPARIAEWWYPAMPPATIATVPPVAPQTEGAMTVPGVWTPDYAAERTNREVAMESAMVRAAAEARASGAAENPDPDSGACLLERLGLPCWSLWAVGGLAVGALAIGFTRGRR